MRLPTNKLDKVVSPGERRLTFGEHLDELRTTVLKCLVATVLMALICLVFQDELMAILRGPYDRMAVNAEKSRAEAAKEHPGKVEEQYETLEDRLLQYEEWVRKWPEIREGISGEGSGEKVSPAVLAALDHLQGQADEIHRQVLRMRADERKIRSIKPTVVFVSYLKASLVAGLFLAFPYVLFRVWMFVGAGLYPMEQRYVLTFLPVSIILFAMGILFGYFILVPIGLSFLASYGGPDILIAFTLDHYLSLFITLTLLLGVVFELPLVMIFVTRIGVLSPDEFAKYRKYSILFAVIAAAFLTPPDPATQMLMAGPLIVLYEIGIWMSRLMGRPRRS